MPRTPVLGSTFGVVAALAATLALAACGGTDPGSVDDALLDVAPEALEIESATCPDDADYDNIGELFECTATTSSGDELTVPGEVTAEGETTFDFAGLTPSGATGAQGSN